MIRANGKRRGFTLIELLVVIAMIALIVGAMSTAVTSAQNRSRFHKATSDVKVISQAILSYQDFSSSGKLEEMTDAVADSKNLKFLLGDGETRSNQELPTLLMAALRGRGQILDPWGHPYLVSIKKRTGRVEFSGTDRKIGVYVPNFHRLSDTEREVIWEGTK